jgi:hypothetical protein
MKGLPWKGSSIGDSIKVIPLWEFPGAALPQTVPWWWSPGAEPLMLPWTGSTGEIPLEGSLGVPRGVAGT